MQILLPGATTWMTKFGYAQEMLILSAKMCDVLPLLLLMMMILKPLSSFNKLLLLLLSLYSGAVQKWNNIIIFNFVRWGSLLLLLVVVSSWVGLETGDRAAAALSSPPQHSLWSVPVIIIAFSHYQSFCLFNGWTPPWIGQKINFPIADLMRWDEAIKRDTCEHCKSPCGGGQWSSSSTAARRWLWSNKSVCKKIRYGQ